MQIIITAVLITITAFCVSVCETLQHRFNSSVFRNLNPYWWNPSVSWKNKRAGWFNRTIAIIWSDAWHLFKFIALVSMAGALALYMSFINVCALWMLYFFVFQIFYNKLWKT